MMLPLVSALLTCVVALFRSRASLCLAMDCPESRPVASPDQGRVIAVPEVVGLHHHYERRAA
jgi:hypothetical protein